MYTLAMNLKFLDPRCIAEKDKNCTRLKTVLNLLIHCSTTEQERMKQMK